jgi:hypothetical protein
MTKIKTKTKKKALNELSQKKRETTKEKGKRIRGVDELIVNDLEDRKNKWNRIRNYVKEKVPKVNESSVCIQKINIQRSKGKANKRSEGKVDKRSEKPKAEKRSEGNDLNQGSKGQSDPKKNQIVKVVRNSETNEIYFGIVGRLGVGKTAEDESVYGEVYNLYFPYPVKSYHEATSLVGKVIPLTVLEYNMRNDIRHNSWKEIYILDFITKQILNKKISPNFSYYYGNFICSNGNFENFSNINVINRIKMRTLIETIKEHFDELIKIIDNFKYTGKTDKEIVTSLKGKIKFLGEDINNTYDQTLSYPTQKYNIIALMEFELISLKKVITSNLVYVTLVKNFHDKIKSKGTLEKPINKLYKFWPEKKDAKITPANDGILIYSLFFQILHSIMVLNSYGIFHTDLHSGNVLATIYYYRIDFIKKCERNEIDFWKYQIENKIYYIPNYNYQTRIIDFGLAEMKFNFVEKSSAERAEMILTFIDRLASFSEDSIKKRVANSRSTMKNNLKNAKAEIIWPYLKFYDAILIFLAMIFEIRSVLKQQYEFAFNRLKERKKKDAKIDPEKKVNEYMQYIFYFVPFLEIMENRAINFFITSLSDRSGLQKLKSGEFEAQFYEIFSVFESQNVDTTGATILNNKAFTV